LTPERWMRLAPQQQVLMIANELHRAGNWIAKNAWNEVNACYERAFELCDLTGEDVEGLFDKKVMESSIWPKFEAVARQCIDEGAEGAGQVPHESAVGGS